MEGERNLLRDSQVQNDSHAPSPAPSTGERIESNSQNESSKLIASSDLMASKSLLSLFMGFMALITLTFPSSGWVGCFGIQSRGTCHVFCCARARRRKECY